MEGVRTGVSQENLSIDSGGDPDDIDPSWLKIWSLQSAAAALYFAFGTIYGLMQGGLPPLLRARGVDLASIGWSFIVLIPFGLTFLWAPVIDRFRITKTAPRIGWIVAMQVTIALGLLLVAESEALPLPVLLAIGLLIGFAAATMDVALDALCSASIPANARATAGGLKVGSLAVGSMVGGGLLVVVVERIGWEATFQLCAVASLAATLPVLLARQWDQDIPRQGLAPPSILAVLRRPHTRQRLTVLAACTTALVALSFFNRIMLVDLGVSLEKIGWIVGIGAPVCGLLASAIAVPLVRRVGTRAGIYLFSAACILSASLMLAGTSNAEASLAIAGAVTINAGSNGIFVILCASTLGWARSAQPATDYAVLYGLSRLLATVVLIAVSRFVPLLGWPNFYALTGIVMIVVAVLARNQLPELRGVNSATDLAKTRAR